jgi:hypothetical protein
MYTYNFFPGYTKIMVALGNTSTGPTNSVEIIDLASTEFTCNKFPSYPFETLRARGELGFHEILLICGGYDPNRNECNTFEHGEWRPFASMTEARHDFAIMKSPFGNDTIFFLTGGKNEQHSTEVLKKGGFKKAPVQVPIDIAYHCMILLNRTNIIVIGGMQDSSYSAKTHILSTENIHWSNGPRLGVPRVLHSCSKIAKNSMETEKSVIVAGGWTVSDGDTSTVEILDVGSNKWRKGPDLPFGICCSSMVEHPSGGVALIGGRRDGSTNLDTIFHLPHAGEDAKWKELPQKLKIGRTLHTAFLIPDAVADSCQV